MLINWIKSVFCKHEFEIVEDTCWVSPSSTSMDNFREIRKFLVCLKCGQTNKISRR